MSAFRHLLAVRGGKSKVTSKINGLIGKDRNFSDTIFPENRENNRENIFFASVLRDPWIGCLSLSLARK
jgi:hypothetical protein